MSEAFRLGGWGMYPTTMFGLLLLFVAGAYAFAPQAHRRLLIGELRKLTMLAATLGFIAGVIKTLTAAGEIETFQVFGQTIAIGIGESAVNLGLGVALLIVSRILTAIGAARSTARPGAELVDPQA